MTTRGEAMAREPDGDALTPSTNAEQRILMTLRVSHDSGRTWGQTTEVRDTEKRVILDHPGGFPPCTCPRRANHSARSEASPHTELG